MACVAAAIPNIEEGSVRRELGAEVPGRLEDVGVARDWSLAKKE